MGHIYEVCYYWTIYSWKKGNIHLCKVWFSLIYRYTYILQETIISFFNEISGDLPIFQQDNATPHVSCHTMKWFTERNITVMKFSPCSSDLNLMENIWAELSRMIYSGNRVFHSRRNSYKSLGTRVTKSIKTRKTLHQSVLRRYMDVLERRGGEINY